MRHTLGILLLFSTLGCSTIIQFEQPTRGTTEDGKSNAEHPDDVDALGQIPVRLDQRLVGLVETVEHDVLPIEVEVGQAIAWAFRDDSRSRIQLRLADSGFGPGGDQGSLFAGNFETTYTLFLVVTTDDGEPESLVATGRSSSTSASRAVRRAVENCVADMRAQVSDIHRHLPEADGAVTRAAND